MIAYSAVPHIIASGAISLILSEQADVQVKLSVMQKVEHNTKWSTTLNKVHKVEDRNGSIFWFIHGRIAE
jgi:hypothetical protein